MQKKVNVRTMAVTAILGAVATVLMFFSFHVPVILPTFLSMDFSELPARIASFTLGPVSGATVCLIKNVVNLPASGTGGAGELCNFLMGVTFVVPAGLIYKYRKNRAGAVVGSFVGALVMAILSLPINLFISYPAYAVFYGMTTDKVMAMYQAILPWVKTLPQALLVFNIPFTFCKAMCSVLITLVIYKRISPLIKGTIK